MSYTDFIYALGDGILGTTSFLFETNIGYIFNYLVLLVGFIGAIYWLRIQAKAQREERANESK